MAWSYSGDPSSSTRDAVRFLVGDTSESKPELQDEEIAWFLSQYDGTLISASYAALAIAARYAREVDKHVGSMSLSSSQKAAAYRELAKQLKEQAADAGEIGSGFGFAPIPYAGGIRVADKEIRQDDDTFVSPAFVRAPRLAILPDLLGSREND